jgi:type IV pilus assembly protein PilO
MNLSEVNWDVNAAGSWPLPIKAGAVALICCLVAGALIYYDTLPQLDELNALEKKESDLKVEFEFKQKKAINLQDYIDQLEAK